MNTEQYAEMIRVTDTYLLTKFQKLKLRIEPIDRINHLLQRNYSAFNVDDLANLPESRLLVCLRLMPTVPKKCRAYAEDVIF